MGDDATLEALKPRVSAILGNRATLVTAVKGMLEILPAGTTKGGGLKWVSNYLGVDSRQVMAVGDGENDIEMLQMAGLSVAMGNSVVKLKNVAHFITKNNNSDGLAQAVEHFALDPGYWSLN